MRPRVVPPACPNPMPTAPTPNRVISLRMFWRPNRPSSRPARICEPSLRPRVRYTCRMSMAAPDCTSNWSWTPAFWICGANPKWMPRVIPDSLPFASNVAKVGSSPVRMLEFAASPASVFSLVKLQKALTFPANENDQPFDICIVRPCALAVAVTPSARPNNSNVRRFIREPLLGSWAARCLLVWLLTTPVYDQTDKESRGAHLLFESDSPLLQTLYLLAGVAARDGVPGDPGPKGKPTFRAPPAPKSRKILGMTPP